MSEVQTKHPASLRIFFATEMWERYGFYVVQTLLALYLAQHFNWNDKDIYALVGSFTALTYVSPVVGGFLADRFLGQKRSILIGGVILFIFYLILGLVASDDILILSLAGIAVGTGLFKPNISSLLGNEYPENSPKRESGFTIFYMGITSGIILGCTFPSYLVHYFNWSLSFTSAALGMLIGLAVFIVGVYRYGIKDYNPFNYQFIKIIQAVIAILFLWGGSFCILHYTALADFAFIGIVLISGAYFLHSIRQESQLEARKTSVIAILCIISIIFWAFYFQMFLSFTLFLSRVVEQTLFNLRFPPPYYVSAQSIGAIIFGIFLSRRKNYSTKTPQGVQSSNKFLLSMFFMTAAFLLITLICRFNPGPNLLSPLYFIPAYLLISLAELLLYPVGLSAVTVLSSRNKVSTMMGVFFVSLGVGGFLSGKLAEIAAISPEQTSTIALKAHYATAFSHITYILIASLFVCILLNRLVKYLLSTESSIDHNSAPGLNENKAY